MVWQRIRNHPGLAALLVLLLILPAPLVWLGSSTDLLDPVLYSAVIEADVVFDAECNMVSRQVTRELGPQDRVAKLEALSLLHLAGWHFHSKSHSSGDYTRAMWKHLVDAGWTPEQIDAWAEVFSCEVQPGVLVTHAKLWRTGSWEVGHEQAIRR